MADKCQWCGHPPCVGSQPSYPHHFLCCLDQAPQPCWGSAPACSACGSTERHHVEYVAKTGKCVA